MLLTGGILWNFVFLVPSILFGLFTSLAPIYFTTFTVVSLGVLLTALFFIIRKILREPRSFKNLLSKLFQCGCLQRFKAIYLVLLWGFIILLTVYSPLIQNIDALLYYLPVSKALLQTGGLTYNPLYLSKIAMTYPPALPLIYAFVMNLSGDVTIRFIPIIFFLLTNLVIYKISSHLFDQKTKLLPLVAYSSMLATQMLVVLEGLSLDLGFVFYMMMAMYTLLKAFKEKGRFWYLMAGMSCGMAALTKEIGILSVLLTFSLLILNSIWRHRRLLFFAISTLFFTVLTTLDLVGSVTSRSQPSWIVSSLHQVFLITVIGLLLWFLSKPSLQVKSITVNNAQIIAFLAPAIIPCIFYLRNFLAYGVFTPGFAPSLTQAMAEIAVPQVWPSPQLPDLSSPLAVPYILHLEWYVVFVTAAVGLLYLIPELVGLFSLVQRFRILLEQNIQVVLIWFVTLLGLLSFLSSFFGWQSYELSFWPSYQYRRLYYFAPLLSLMIVEGISVLYYKFDLGRKIELAFITFNTFVLVYVWGFRQSFDNFMARWIFKGTLWDLLLFTSLFVLILLGPSILKGVIMSWKTRSSQSGPPIFMRGALAMILIVNLALPVHFLSVSVSQINGVSWDPTYYNGIEAVPTALQREPWLEVIDYFNQQVNDDYVTVMFNSYVFVYFAERPVIDPYRNFCYEPLIPLLQLQDEQILLTQLFEQNIRYFLIPKPSSPEMYQVYQDFAEKYLLFKTVTEHDAFMKVQEFTFYDLYMLQQE